MNPFVSVAMISYNHRPYIAQALESVLAQQCDFPFEIVISDDRSPDGTAAVIDGYQAKHPSIFQRLDPPRNVGMHANFDRVWQACRGKYVAILEGDDFWHDSGKLRQQVQFMNAHPKMTVSGHSVWWCDESGQRERAYPPHPEGIAEEASVERLLLEENYLQTCSTMFRRGFMDRLPAWMYRLGFADHSCMVLHGFYGTVGFFPACLATYRRHAGGVWTGKEKYEKLFQYYVAIREYASLPEEQVGPYRRRLRELQHSLADELRESTYWARREGRYRDAFKVHRELLRLRWNRRDAAAACKSLVGSLTGVGRG